MNALEIRRRLLLGSVPHEYILTKEGVPPLSFYSNGKPLLSYEIAGNTVQDGVPSPDNPVEVMGVGDVTVNKFNSNDGAYGQWISSSGTIQMLQNGYTMNTIEIDGSYYAVRFFGDIPYSCSFCWYDSEKNFILRNHWGIPSDRIYSISPPQNAKYLVFQVAGYAGEVFDKERVNAFKIMLWNNRDDIPYEPYGYKIPVTCGGAAENIYLASQLMQGEILKSSNEREVKWGIAEFKGTEYWIGFNGNYFTSLIDGKFISYSELYSSHFRNDITDGLTLGAETERVALRLSNNNRWATVGELKAWLESEYNAGRPVIIYYQLKEPVVETVTAPEVPTLKGTNTLTVDTEVQPSNVKIEYRSSRKG